jgi:citronellol/citronellal dehydrogenase
MQPRSIFRDDLFSDQTYLITGGGSGIGRMVAHELASLGANVVIAGRKQEKLAQVEAEITAVTQAPHRIASHPVNIRDPESGSALIQFTLQKFGRLDGLVNNAGGQFPSPAEYITPKGWHAVIETNLSGAFYLSQHAFNQWMGAHGGAIVNMVAEMWRGFPGMAHTGAARAAVVNLTQTLAVEWARAGVRVNAVAPGIIQGSGLASYDEMAQQFIELSKKDMPYFRLGTESEVSAAIVFLLSPAASYISGETLKIDGASSLWRKTWLIPEHENAPRPWELFGNE